ncbi:hypothetical protein CPBF367_21420 [Xanthomonas arboricola pv. juglandis]|nr:hypothetical protein CPBF367_21420 [Xanthomonas arboricola pv. juglandis]
MTQARRLERETLHGAASQRPACSAQAAQIRST